MALDKKRFTARSECDRSLGYCFSLILIKLQSLMIFVTNVIIFVDVKAHVCVTEFQKRGLTHAHGFSILALQFKVNRIQSKSVKASTSVKIRSTIICLFCRLPSAIIYKAFLENWIFHLFYERWTWCKLNPKEFFTWSYTRWLAAVFELQMVRSKKRKSSVIEIILHGLEVFIINKNWQILGSIPLAKAVYFASVSPRCEDMYIAIWWD